MWTRAIFTVLTVAVIAVGFAYGNPDPWPNYSSHTDYVRYVEILPINSSGDIWQYYATVLSGTYETEHGGVVGIKALAIYPNGGEAEPALDGWTGDSTYVRPNWNNNGGWHTQQGAFGYLTGGPTYYIVPGQTGELIGAATFPTSYIPPDQVSWYT